MSASTDLPVYNATGGRNTWATPPAFLRAAAAALGVEDFALDIAALGWSSQGRRYFGPDAEIMADRDAFGGDHPPMPRTAGLAPGSPELVARWRADGARYANPPYSRACLACRDGEWKRATKTRKGCSAKGHASRTVTDWMRAIAAAGVDPEGGGPFLALPAFRPATEWFSRHVHGVARRVVLPRGRLRFETGPGKPAKTGAPFPSCLIEYVPPPPGWAWVTQYGAINADGTDPDIPPPVVRRESDPARSYVVRGSVACLLGADIARQKVARERVALGVPELEPVEPPADREWLARVETAAAEIRGAYGPEALAGLPPEYLTGGRVNRIAVTVTTKPTPEPVKRGNVKLITLGGGAEQGGEDSGAAARQVSELRPVRDGGVGRGTADLSHRGVCGCCGAPRGPDASMTHDGECIWHPSRDIGLSPY